MPNHRPALEIRALDSSPEEAAAVVAALERFWRETAPVPAVGAAQSPWLRAARLEAVGREQDATTPWGDPHAWG